MDTTFFDVFLTVLGISCLALFSLVVMWLNNYLKHRMSKEEYDYLTKVTAELVDAAEQQMKAGDLSPDLRFRWVREQLLLRVSGMSLEQANAMIHAQVWRLNQGGEDERDTKKGISSS